MTGCPSQTWMLFYLSPGGKVKQLRYLWVLHKEVSSVIELTKSNLTSQMSQWNGNISAFVPRIWCNDLVEC
eukprot:12882142-Prorocentrum_lima.AAC.1